MRYSIFPLAVLVIALNGACTKDDSIISSKSAYPLASLDLPGTYFNYANPVLPDHLTTNAFPMQLAFQNSAISFDNTPKDIPTTNEGATLGRVLFYDTKLSANGTRSCASCHAPEHGFSDPNVFSVGFEGGLTGRHSMGIANASFYASGKFFWDERAETLEDQVLMPFQDPVEMGLTLEELESIVREQEYYPTLFDDAFGDEIVTSDRIAKALAQFVRSMVSYRSNYDLARAEVNSPLVNFPAFSPLENLGKSLFFQPIAASNGAMVTCASCHVSEAFIGHAPIGPNSMTNASNIGLDANSTVDPGVFGANANPADLGKFKVPSLKNIGARPPYMHDGRFATLEEVVQHYNTGIQDHPNLSAALRDPNGNPVRLNLNQMEVNALVAFLNTLTDDAMTNDEKFSDPFR